MGGTHSGGKQAALTNTQTYGPDFYSRIGAKGGANGHTGGFHNNRELARIAGALGGSISRRGSGNKPKKRLSKHQVDEIKAHFRERMAELRQQSDTQVMSLSAKYGTKRSW